jgi:hypothetical protein
MEAPILKWGRYFAKLNLQSISQRNNGKAEVALGQGSGKLLES